MTNQRTVWGPQTALKRLLEDDRKKLFETGARNLLIHTARENKRSKSKVVEAADPDQVFNLLVRDWRSFGFLPAPDRVVLEDGRIGVHPRPLDPQDQASKSDCSDSHRDGRTVRRPRREHRTSVRDAREALRVIFASVRQAVSVHPRSMVDDLGFFIAIFTLAS
jgi:hypothetical protein